MQPPRRATRSTRSFARSASWLYFNDLVEREPDGQSSRVQQTDASRRRTASRHCLALTGRKLLRRMRDVARTPVLVDPRLASALAEEQSSRLRLRHIDLERGWITFYEKGAKVIDKPIPDAYTPRSSEKRDQPWRDRGDDPDAYVVPMLRPQRRKGERDDPSDWRPREDDRPGASGIETHPHALSVMRSQFGSSRQHPGEIEALQRLLGHSKIETTQGGISASNGANASNGARS